MNYRKRLLAIVSFLILGSVLAMEEGRLEAEIRNTGNWLDESIPKKNWTCNEMEDLYENRMNCTMCSTPDIRILHWMKNENYKHSIAVDVHCAGRMEGNLEAARAREKNTMLRAEKRAVWAMLGWVTKEKTFWKPEIVTLKTTMVFDNKEHTIIITPKEGKYSVKIDEEKPLPLLYPTLERAKLGAFDILWPSKVEGNDSNWNRLIKR